MEKIICFDIGGTKIANCVVDIGKTSGNYKILDYNEQKNPRNEKKIKELMIAFIQEANKKYTISRVSISSAGIVDMEKQIINRAAPYYGKDRFDFTFLKNGKVPFLIDNDANCFALGEYFSMKDKPLNLLALTLGTGVGGGLVIDGRLFRGAHFSAMEVGKMILKIDEKIDFTKQKGQWELKCAGEGMEKQAKMITGNALTSEEIFATAKKKPELRPIIETATKYFQYGLVNMLNLLDPDLIVFGGGLSEQEYLIRNAMQFAKKNAFNKKAPYKYRISKLKHQANLIGAACLWNEEAVRGKGILHRIIRKVRK